MSALGQAQRMASGELSCVDATTETLSAIERGDSAVGAFLTVTPDAALDAAREVDRRRSNGERLGPLAGVPVALKDNICTRGIETTAGSKILRGWKPPYDATVVQRLRLGGLIVVGKTNLDEFAMGSSTENSAYQLTRNPRDPQRVPGGSSGGSAAAVAASMVPLALGSDTGGSIRQPASFRGEVGAKTTYGRVSRLGLIAYASSLDQIGPLTHNVADAAALLETIAGHDPLDSTSIPSEAPHLTQHLDDGVEGLRVGVIRELMGEGIDPQVRSAVSSTAELLARQGARVEEISLPALGHALSAYYLVATAEASSNLARFDGVRFGLRVEASTTPEMYVETRSAGFGEEVQRRIMLGTYALSAGYYDEYYATAQRVRTLVVNDFNRAYRDVDVLLSPVAPTTAFRFGEHSADPLTMYLQDICTIPSNMAGHPAMSVPIGNDSSGLPIGVQLLAPALGEVDMFRAGKVVEWTHS